MWTYILTNFILKVAIKNFKHIKHIKTKYKKLMLYGAHTKVLTYIAVITRNPK